MLSWGHQALKRNPAELTDREFDAVILGGGITGAFVALELTLRGLEVALIERDDFGAATSSASSKVLHGGIRYLQQARVGKLRESALERARFQVLAPHLTRYVPFLVPTYRDVRKGRTLLATALAIYAAACAGQNRLIPDLAKRVPQGALIGRDEALRRAPQLDDPDLTGAALYYESHMHSSERMTLAVLASAHRRGARLANYVRAEEFLRTSGRVSGVRAVDLASGSSLEIRAKITVNAAGPWIPQLLAGLDETGIGKQVTTGYSKGGHLVTRQLVPEVALALPTKARSQAVLDRGGRHLFIIPWRGHSLIGTTYAPHRGPLDKAGFDEVEITEFIDTINETLPGLDLARDDVVHSFVGLYPLSAAEVRPDVYQGTGEYVVLDHRRCDNVDGLVSVLGAKFTTARRLAEKAGRLIVAKLGRGRRGPVTQGMALDAGAIDDIQSFYTAVHSRYAEQLDRECIDHLAAHYGNDITEVTAATAADPGLNRRLVADRPLIGAQIDYAAREEMVVHLSDVVFRRTGLGTIGHPGEACLRYCARIIGGIHNWDSQRREWEVRDTERRFAAAGVSPRASAMERGTV